MNYFTCLLFGAALGAFVACLLPLPRSQTCVYPTICDHSWHCIQPSNPKPEQP